MKNSSGRSPRRRSGEKQEQGVALVIVLAFVVILTGVVIAYFTRSLANRQISNSSANQTKSSLFAQGASDSIIADLQQEIIVASTGTSNAANTATYYLPKTGANGAAPIMLPQLAGTTGLIMPWAPNLLARSAFGQNFYSDPYGTGSNIVGNAVNVSSTTPSINGRYISPARWNKHYLLPLASGSDSTPLSSGTGAFYPPDWVLVARNGSSPTTVSGSLGWSATNGTTVIGRYAYAIYHEGGMLDANVAGYPTTVNSRTETGYKPALAFADLTAIGMSSTAVNALVAWRNAVSAEAQNAYTNANPFGSGTATSTGTDYFNYVINNPNGFLQISSTGLNPGSNGTTQSSVASQGQSDHMFSSRQQLISFFQKGLGITGTGLNTLNYLGTFTRGIDQPSYSPDPTRPLITWSYLNGGNNLNQSGGSASDYEVKDSANNPNDPVNPSFLTVTVTGTFTRNDGTTAIIGQPLVKTRFPLSRLAWITYKGPSALRNFPTSNPGTTSPDYDMWKLMNIYGVPKSYLLLGTTNAIYTNFGLQWLADTLPSARSGLPASFHDGSFKWFYSGHMTQSGSAIPGNATLSNTMGSISRLQAIANLGTKGREPDFFELLKAGVADGSIAKGSMSMTAVQNAGQSGGDNSVGYGPSHPYYYQTKLDTNLDFSLIQLGANIIDQAKVDGYATRIVFNDGSDPIEEFRGSENLPYIYRLNSAAFKLRAENPLQTGSNPSTGALLDTGIGLLCQIPTIWNPYDSASPIGIPGPANSSLTSTNNFRLVADSVTPENIVTQPTTFALAAGYSEFQASAFDDLGGNHFTSNTTGTNYNNGIYTTGRNGTAAKITPPITLTPAAPAPVDNFNEQLTFCIPNNQVFREPTPLVMVNTPTGTFLQYGSPPSNIAQYASIQNSSGSNAYSGGGFTSDDTNPMNLASAPPTNQHYVPIGAALFPIVFASGSGATATIYQSQYVTLVTANNLGPYIAYRLQYLDPNTAIWNTYDQKFTWYDEIFLEGAVGSKHGSLVDSPDGAPGGDWASYIDPRTSRFCEVNGRDLGSQVATPGETGETQEYPDSSLTDKFGPIMLTDRPDINGGYAISVDRTAAGGVEFEALAAAGWTLTNIGNGHMRVGMFEQNSDKIFDNGLRFNGDNAKNYGTATDGPQLTYYVDPDGVLRGGMGYYQLGNGSAPAISAVGLPLATAYTATASFTAPSTTGTYQAQSRPWFLHRPFHSVAELGYVFSGTPWKNLDFFTPQSGDSALLDIFSANEPPAQQTSSVPVIAGVVNLNTQQAPVLAALVAGAYADEALSSGTYQNGVQPMTQTAALLAVSGSNNSAIPLINRTAQLSSKKGLGPLQNVGDIVGRWVPGLVTGTTYYTGYSGPSGDLTNVYANAFSGLPQMTSMQDIQRFRESALRPLAAAGDTRVWNLLIDVVAQTGRYPQNVTNGANFIVDGEQRFWVHVAIDRYTGQVLDKQVELVKE